MSGDTMDFYQARLELLTENNELRAEIARLRKELAAKERDYGILLNSHVDLTHKLNSMRVELRDAQQREREAVMKRRRRHASSPDILVKKLMWEQMKERAELAERREREALAMLLAYCEHTSLAFTSSGPLQPFSGTQLTQLRALLSRAREQANKQEVPRG